MGNSDRASWVRLLQELFVAWQQAPAADPTRLQQQISLILEPATAPRAEPALRLATILLSDLRGFVLLAEKFGSLEMMKLLDVYLSRMSEVVVAHGGRIDKFMGDAILAVFDQAAAPEADVEAALACAATMQIAMDDVNKVNARHGMPELFMGIGINTGEVAVGWVGSDAHREYTVIGDQVNLTSRIEAYSLRGQILLSESTYRLAKDFIETGGVRDIRLKGRQSFIRIHELLATLRPHRIQVPRREIRHAPRVSVDLPMKFQLLSGKSIDSQEHQARVVDISYGGMRIETDMELDLMTEMKLGLTHSLRGDEASEIYARVMGLAVISGRQQYRLEFTAIEPDCAQIIREMVDGLLSVDGLG